MAMLTVSLFGRLSVAVDGQPLPPFESRKVEELFCYLLLTRGRPKCRESLVELLWPEATPRHGRNYLRKALWQLQRAFTAAGPEPVVVEPEWIYANTAAPVELDVGRFEAAFQQALHQPGRTLPHEVAAVLHQAVELYRGDLLENWYQEWLLIERERLRLGYIMMLEKLMAYCEAHGDYEAGLEYGLRVLSLDHAHERTHRLLMRFYMMAGRPAAALQQYERCAAILRKELGVDPAPVTTALSQHIRAGRPLAADRPLPPVVDGTHTAPESLAPVPATTGDVGALQLRLAALENVLHQAQDEVRSLRALLA